MNKKYFLAMAMLLPQCLVAASFNIYLTNPTNQEKTDEPVVLQLDEYEQIKPEQRAQLAVFLGKEQICSQLDDLNGDGVADELAFLVDLGANETRKATVKTIPDSKRKEFLREVNAQMWRKDKGKKTMYPVTEASSTKNDMYNQMHHHGVAWESDIMAYRIYFDNKQTIDVYGKKKRQLELEACRWYPNDEQLAAGFGDDILRVSGSVGVGAVKPWNGKKSVHITEFDKRTQRIVSQGPLRTICEISVEGWKYENKSIDMTVRYTMYARHRDCQVDVFTSVPVDTLVTGVQKIKGAELYESADMVGAWGTDWPVNDTVKYAKETVGIAVYMPEKQAVRQAQDKVNNLLFFSNSPEKPTRFYLTTVSMKEIGNPINNAPLFFAYMDKWKANCSHPIIISEKKLVSTAEN